MTLQTTQRSTTTHPPTLTILLVKLRTFYMLQSPQQGKLPIKVKFGSDSTKSFVTILLYHLKAFLYGFIFSRGYKSLGAPFMVKNRF